MSKGQKCPNPKCEKQTFMDKGGVLGVHQVCRHWMGMEQARESPRQGQGKQVPQL